MGGRFGERRSQLPLSRTAPRWDNAADRALALRMVKALRLDDDRAREALAQIWIEAGAFHLRARHQRRAAAPPALAPEVAPAGGWLITLNGRPYTRAHTFCAVAFWVHRRRSNGRWAVFVTGDGAPLVLPLEVSRAQFERAVGQPGAYRLVPVDASGERVSGSPAVITL